LITIYFSDYYSGNTTTMFYVGLNRSSPDSDWVWADGEPFSGEFLQGFPNASDVNAACTDEGPKMATMPPGSVARVICMGPRGIYL